MIKESIVLFSILAVAISPVFADSHGGPDRDAKMEFASALEETLGHFRALELNLDEKNSKLALAHATHPISELYGTMEKHLADNPEFAEKLKQTLLDLQDKATTDVDRDDAQAAIDEAKQIIEEARQMVVGKEMSQDPRFKMQLINGLLETAKVEYAEAVEEGEITEMAEFQDGSSFVWRSQQIYMTIQSGIDPIDSSRIDDYYVEVWNNFDKQAEPENTENWIDAVIYEFEELSGIPSMASKHEMMETEHEDKMEMKDEDEMKHEDEMQMKDEDEMEHEDEMHMTLPPLKQIQEGIEVEEITCKSNMTLVFAPDGDPACVKQSSVAKLAQRGWAI